MHTFSFIFKICKNKLFLGDEELNSSLKCHLSEFRSHSFLIPFFPPCAVTQRISGKQLETKQSPLQGLSLNHTVYWIDVMWLPSINVIFIPYFVPGTRLIPSQFPSQLILIRIRWGELCDCTNFRAQITETQRE